jgi:hypothetical protein
MNEPFFFFYIFSFFYNFLDPKDFYGEKEATET